MFESKSGVLLIGGLGFFVFAFLSNALVPDPDVSRLARSRRSTNWSNEQQPDVPVRRPAAVAIPSQFAQVLRRADARELRRGAASWAGRFTSAKAAGTATASSCGRSRTRSAAGDRSRKTEEYQNELQRPVMFGTRRVGPDLSREGGRRANDWHAVHFFQPTMVSTDSPMPEYPWFFDGAPDKPNRRGLALMTYVQWLGSWLESYPYYEDYEPIARRPT